MRLCIGYNSWYVCHLASPCHISQILQWLRCSLRWYVGVCSCARVVRVCGAGGCCWLLVKIMLKYNCRHSTAAQNITPCLGTTCCGATAINSRRRSKWNGQNRVCIRPWLYRCPLTYLWEKMCTFYIHIIYISSQWDLGTFDGVFQVRSRYAPLNWEMSQKCSRMTT